MRPSAASVGPSCFCSNTIPSVVRVMSPPTQMVTARTCSARKIWYEAGACQRKTTAPATSSAKATSVSGETGAAKPFAGAEGAVASSIGRLWDIRQSDMTASVLGRAVVLVGLVCGLLAVSLPVLSGAEGSSRYVDDGTAAAYLIVLLSLSSWFPAEVGTARLCAALG